MTIVFKKQIENGKKTAAKINLRLPFLHNTLKAITPKTFKKYKYIAALETNNRLIQPFHENALSAQETALSAHLAAYEKQIFIKNPKRLKLLTAVLYSYVELRNILYPNDITYTLNDVIIRTINAQPLQRNYRVLILYDYHKK